MLVSGVNTIFIFNHKTTLEINVNLALHSDINLILICNIGFGLLNANFVIVFFWSTLDFIQYNSKANTFILKAKKAFK